MGWLVLFLLLSLSNGSSFLKIEEFLESEKYDKMIRPNPDGIPVLVSLDLYVIAFGIIEEVNMELPVFIYLRQSWSEPRFINQLNSTRILNREILEKVWRPDTFCTNARETDLMMPDTEIHSSIIAKPDGSVLYSRGSKIVASCNMDLRSFPFDKQKCFLKFGSYSYNAEDLIYKWKPDSNVEIEDSNLAQFIVTGVEESTVVSRYATGNFSHFLVHFTFERRLGYYILQVYIPCILIVIISWIIFWMDIEDTGNRVTVGITAVLTIMFLGSFVNSMMPKVSYVKAIDWYLIISMSFIFLALVDSIIIAYYMKPKQPTVPPGFARQERVGCRLADARGDIKLERFGSENSSPRMSLNNNEESTTQHKQPALTCSEIIDRSSRVVFPVSYIVLNIVYWSVYAS